MPCKIVCNVICQSCGTLQFSVVVLKPGGISFFSFVRARIEVEWTSVLLDSFVCVLYDTVYTAIMMSYLHTCAGTNRTLACKRSSSYEHTKKEALVDTVEAAIKPQINV